MTFFERLHCDIAGIERLVTIAHAAAASYFAQTYRQKAGWTLNPADLPNRIALRLRVRLQSV